ncbi:MAG TPA: flagellar FliJ family protein [Nitrospira sp.]|nr:flagellar FliJ family protein [Nitrospira sp.]
MNIGGLTHYQAQIEERLVAECEALTRSLEDAQAARARLEAEEERHVQAYLHQSRIGMLPSEAGHLATSLDALASLIAKTKDRERVLRDDLERKRAEALEASRERRKFERLEGRQQAARRRVEEQRAQRLTDEAAARGAQRERDVP